MDFSLTTLFILPASNTLPTTGSTQDLVASQFGIFLQDYTVATTGNIGAAKYIYAAQGRNVTLPGAGSKRSDKINVGKIVEWYKVPAVKTYTPQIDQIGNFTVQCGESITFTFRLHESYIDTGFFNGFQRSITVQAPCCNCGANPCTTIDATALIDEVIAKIQQDKRLSKYLTATRIGTGTNAVLNVAGNLLDKYSQPCDVAAYPYEYNRLWFRAFVTPGAATTQDFEVYDACDQAGTVTVLQRATYPTGFSDEISQLEKNYYSYQSTQKSLFRNAIYNNAFSTEVVSGTFYDTYVIKCREYDTQLTWVPKVEEDFIVMLAIPNGQTATLETLLVDYLGAITSYVTTAPTTTSTTSTTSTSTTTTSTLEP